MSNVFTFNDLLLDQTMLCEASRLLQNCPEGESFGSYFSRFAKGQEIQRSRLYHLYEHERHSWSPSNTERLFNLSLLLDGLALHNQLYVLKAELPLDAESLQLRKLLLEKGIVKEIETAPYLPDIRHDFDVYFSQLPLSKHPAGLSREMTAKQIKQLVDEFVGGSVLSARMLESESQKKSVLDALVSMYEGTEEHWQIGNDWLNLPFLTLGEFMLDRVHLYSSGMISGISLLRTFVYWRLSEHIKIPLYSSSRRLPLLSALTEHIQLHSSERIYQAIADVFKEDIDMIREDDAAIPFVPPPSLSVFLTMYRSSHNLSKTIDDFRGEFAGVRQEFCTLAEQRMKARTMQERLDFAHRLNDIVQLVQRHYRRQDPSWLAASLSFAPDVLNPLSNPLDPSKYSTALLAKPIEWIRSWWKRRPLQHVFHLRERLYQLAVDERLASEMLGIEFNAKVTEDFNRHYMEYLDLYKRKS